MRKVLLGIALAVGVAAPAAANCGLQPLSPMPPPGCWSMNAVCVCNERGACGWRFYCGGSSPGSSGLQFNDSNSFTDGWNRQDREMRERERHRMEMEMMRRRY